MKKHPVNAALQIVPLKTADPYPFIDLAIALIEEKKIRYEVGPFSTSLEGNLEDIFDVVASIRDRLYEQNLDEFLVNLQIQFNKQKPVLANEKTEKFKKQGLN